MDNRLATLPDLLMCNNGIQVTTAADWIRKRRPEILELFRTHVYGREPQPLSVRFHVAEEKGYMGGKATRKKVDITFTGPYGKGVIPLLLFVPNAIESDKPAPVFLLINNRDNDYLDLDQEEQDEFWPAKAIVDRGYAAAVFHVKDVDPDEHDGFRNGVHGIFEAPGTPDAPRPSDAWGTIAAWAWGASRVMDYLVTDTDLDANRVAVVGHSRGGKTALWAGALDERFAMIVSNNSGSTGAAISRGKTGETIYHINTRFPHWFAENYKTYNDRENELPVDQHMLLSLIAPRCVYVSSATEDNWADPQSEFLSLKLAEPAYQLLSAPGLGTHSFPQPETPIHGEKLGYHLRTGEHDLKEYDWHCFMDFADKNRKAN
jgi:dienelactone hydrolase